MNVKPKAYQISNLCFLFLRIRVASEYALSRKSPARISSPPFINPAKTAAACSRTWNQFIIRTTTTYKEDYWDKKPSNRRRRHSWYQLTRYRLTWINCMDVCRYQAKNPRIIVGLEKGYSWTTESLVRKMTTKLKGKYHKDARNFLI